MILTVFWYEDFKTVSSFFNFYSPYLKKSKLWFFSKFYLIKISENLSTYLSYECLQRHKKLTSAPTYVTGLIFFFRQTHVFGFSGLKYKHIWQWALVRWECYPPPHRSLSMSFHFQANLYSMCLTIFKKNYSSSFLYASHYKMHCKTCFCL